MKILSYGGGVQSTTLLRMALRGELACDCAVFADTGWEPRAVYEHLQSIQADCERAGFSLHIVSAGNIREDAVRAVHAGSRFATMPFFTKSVGGRIAILRRQCTQEYKVRPIQKKIRELTRKPVVLYLGISLDEIHRVKTSRVQYIRHEYPLIDMRMRRGDCIRYLESHDDPIPMKSSCIGCPFHSNANWKSMKRDRPDEFADAVQVDEACRKLPRLRDATYLHSSCVPLSQIDFESQQEFVFDDCDGFCDV